jgi:hypothetical protein
MRKKITTLISLLSILWLICAPIGLSAQNRRIQTLDDLFTKYEQVKGVGFISISPSLLKLAKPADSKELDEVFNSIASLRILNMDITSETQTLANRIKQDVQNLVKQEHYEEIVKMREGESNFVIYLSKNNDKNSKQLEALLMIASEESELVLIGISGKITQKVIDAILDGKIGIIP